MASDEKTDLNLIENPDAITIIELAKLVQDELKLRKRFFSDLVSDGHSWDVLLTLLAAKNEKKDSSLTAISTLGGIKATTGLRWIDVLRREGLVIIANDVDDGRKQFVFLTERGQSGMESYLGAVAELRQLKMVG
ncbi:MarR family winged helix-turn-helix transcriptional regulator [Parasphingorhabdus cellanae]|uniref:Winged helix-turn-helix transcriptional regulator n=1 Tax=Parasphingorhabdus cellanae TaxID=2806553 RepID=A0ABX7T6P9_9SPHN|nr:MarR family winged helix-turn-helix transcriptional regulator [Parasphingorhabdus cellanae]QTD56467.1 winged helix-turn-helix transcriptional regulator [Parasphingorhabdus cellanae]